DNVGENSVDRCLDLAQRDSVGRDGVNGYLAEIHAGAAIPTTRGRGELIGGNKLLVEDARGSGPGDLHQEIERLGLAWLRGHVARGYVVALHRWLACPRILDLDPAGGPLLGIHRPLARRDLRIGRNPTVSFLCEPAHLFRRDIAGNNEDRVIGSVVPLVEAQRVLLREPRDLVLPADHGNSVWMRVRS